MLDRRVGEAQPVAGRLLRSGRQDRPHDSDFAVTSARIRGERSRCRHPRGPTRCTLMPKNRTPAAQSLVVALLRSLSRSWTDILILRAASPRSTCITECPPHAEAPRPRWRPGVAGRHITGCATRYDVHRVSRRDARATRRQPPRCPRDLARNPFATCLVAVPVPSAKGCPS